MRGAALRVFLLLTMVSGFFVSAVYAQSAADGVVKDGVYRNTYFKREFTIPKSLHAVNLASLHIHTSDSRDAFMLMTARQDNEPYGIVMFAERLHTKPDKIRDEFDFLRRVKNSWRNGEVSEGNVAVLSKNGPTFQELYYMAGGEHDAAIVSRVGAFLLVWRCNAKSAKDLTEMTTAIHSLRPIP